MLKENLKKEYEARTVIITRDNIHLYYEFLSDEEKINYSHTELNLVFHERMSKICDSLDIEKAYLHDVIKAVSTTYYKTNGTVNPDIFNDGRCLSCGTHFGTIGISYFGIKDTLKPIEEYITEIKASEEYKKYMTKNNTKVVFNFESIDKIFVSNFFTDKVGYDNKIINFTTVSEANSFIEQVSNLKTDVIDDVLDLINYVENEDFYILRGDGMQKNKISIAIYQNDKFSLLCPNCKKQNLRKSNPDSIHENTYPYYGYCTKCNWTFGTNKYISK